MAAKKVMDCLTGKPGGFSFLELVIALAVMAVLMTIAVPSYRAYVQRTERANAIRHMLEIAVCQERIRTGSGFYDTSRCLEQEVNVHYTLRIEPPGDLAATRFTVFADPDPGMENRCGSLSLDHTGARGKSSEKATLTQCWGGR